MKMTKQAQLNEAEAELDSYLGWFDPNDPADEEPVHEVVEAKKELDYGVVPMCFNAMEDRVDEIKGRENTDLYDRANDNEDLANALYIQGDFDSDSYLTVANALRVLADVRDNAPLDRGNVNALLKHAREDFSGNEPVMEAVRAIAKPSNVNTANHAYHRLISELNVEPV